MCESMAYRYQMTWTWSSWQRFTAIDQKNLVANLEAQLRKKLLAQKGVTTIESVTTTINKVWNTYVMGIYNNNVQGTTVTVFDSSTPQGEIEILIAVAVIAILAVLGLPYLSTINTALKEIAPAAPILAGGVGAILIVGALLLLPAAVPALKKVAPEVKKAIPEVKKAVGKVEERIHPT